MTLFATFGVVFWCHWVSFGPHSIFYLFLWNTISLWVPLFLFCFQIFFFFFSIFFYYYFFIWYIYGSLILLPHIANPLPNLETWGVGFLCTFAVLGWVHGSLATFRVFWCNGGLWGPLWFWTFGSLFASFISISFFIFFPTYSKATAKYRGPVAFGFQICFSMSSVLATYSITPLKLEKKSY